MRQQTHSDRSKTRESIGRLAIIAITLIVVLGTIAPAIGIVDQASAAHGATHVDDFEDDDLNVETSGWGGWNGDLSFLTTTSTAPIAGDISAQSTNGGGLRAFNVTADSASTSSRIGLRVRIDQAGGTGDDGFYLRTLDSSGSRGVNIRFVYNGSNVEYYDGSSWVKVGNYQEGEVHEIEARNIDWGAGTYDIYLDDSLVQSGATFHEAPTDFDRIKLMNDGRKGTQISAFFDDLEVGGSSFSNYISGYDDDSGSVEYGTIEDFEDGDIVINESETKWSGWYGETGDLSATSSGVINGSYSGRLSVSNANRQIQAVSQTGRYSDSNVALELKITSDTGNSNDEVDVDIVDNTTSDEIIEIVFQMGTNAVLASNGSREDTGADWTPGTEHTLEIKNINWSANTYDLYLDGNQIADGYTFQYTEYEGFNEFQIHANTANSGGSSDVVFDDVRLASASGGGGSGNTISGTVQNQNGEPVPNATVEIWQIKDSELNKDPGETTTDAARDLTENLTRAVPRDRFDPDLDPLRSSDLTGENAGKHVMIHREAAYIDNAREIVGDRKVVTVGSSDLTRPLIELDPGAEYACSIWDRGSEPLLEDGIDDAVDPGVTTEGTVEIRQIGPGNSTVQKIEVETTDQVKTGWPVTVKTHEYAVCRFPVGYFEVVPKSGGTPIVVRVGQPEKIPRHFNKDLEDSTGNVADIAKTTQAEIDAGTFKRVTVETNETGYFTHDVPSGYSTVALTAFDGQGLTEGITDPTIEDLRTQIVQQDYNGSIYLSSSPKVVEPPKSGIVITVVEIERPTFSDLQAYLDLMGWLDELLNEEAFNRLSTLWTDPPNEVTTDELKNRAEELDDLVQQNEDLVNRVEELVSENEDLTKTLEEIRNEIDDGTITREDLEEYVNDLTETIQTSQPTINVNVESPDLEVPENDTEPTLLNLRLPIETRAGEDSSLTKEGVTVLVHFDNGTSSTMNESYWSIDNSIGSSQGTGSEVVISDYPIPADVAVASIELLVANSQGTGREQVSIENPAVSGTPPELASINIGSMRPGPDEKVSITVTPTDSSTYREIAGADVYGPDGSSISTTVSGSKVSFRTNGSGSHLIQLKVSDGSRNYTETIRIKAGNQSIKYPASVRIHDGVLGRTLIASDGVDSAEIDVSRGGSAAQITARVNPSDVPNEIHVHGKEITGLQQDVSVTVVSSSDEARVSRDVLLKLHLSKLSDGAIVRIDGEPVTAGGNQFGKVSDEGDSTLITAVARDGSAEISINNNPSLLDRIIFTVDVEVFQRLPDLPGTSGTILPDVVLGIMGAVA